MNLLVFGASGATGRLVVAQARAAGHAVSAFARRSARSACATPCAQGFPKISRADVAHFMVGALSAPGWVRKRLIVSD